MVGSFFDGINVDQSSTRGTLNDVCLLWHSRTTFTSEEFAEFATKNQIRHITVAPYHLSSNEQIERMVRETKQVLLSCLKEIGQQSCLVSCWAPQHILPSTTTGKSPAELLMGRRLRSASRFHLDGSSLERYFRDDSQRVWEFCPGDAVYAWNYQGSTKWVPEFIASVTGPLSYQVRLSDGRVWRRHVDQLRNRASPLDLGGAASDTCDTTDGDHSPVVGQDPPLPGVNEDSPSPSLPASPTTFLPRPDGPNLPGSLSQERSSPSQPATTGASRYP